MTQSTGKKRRLGIQLAAALAGLGLLGLLVWNIGVGELVGHLRQIGWLAPLLLVPCFLYRLGWVRQGWWVLGPLLVLAYSFAILLIRWQRRGLMGMAVRTLQRLLPHWQRLAQWEARAQRIDAHLLGFYDGNTRGFIASTVYHFLGWLLGAAEVQFFFYLMGVPVAPIDALIIETMVQPLTVAALVIPGALGV